MRSDYENWLKAQGYSGNTISARVANVRTVERAYGESLDDIHARGGLRGLIAELTYSNADERHRRRNPSRVEIQGNVRNGLATLKSAVALYARFIGAPWVQAESDEGTEPDAGPSDAGPSDAGPSDAGSRGENDPAGLEKQRLSLERDMQVALRGDLARLEPGLRIIDDGAERAVASGFIDILARDAAGATVVIELKAGKTDARVIGQVLGYMGDIAAEDEPAALRGIIVAHDFDARTRSAARAVPNLTLVRYAVSFSFSPET